jgi:tripartite-type tricarboxylate transporter receptor subunit TctC
MRTKRGFLLALVASASISAVCPAFAEVYPARPITIVVPFPAGGPADTVGRILAERMRASLGKPLTIENVAGAGGTIVSAGSRGRCPMATRSVWASRARMS